MELQTGLKLQKLRKERGLSQEELANQLNVSRQAVSKWERGEAYPDTDNLILLAKLYKISLDQLVANENTTVSEKPKRKLKTDILGLITAINPFVTLLIYLLLGFVWESWHPGWIVFFNVILTPSLILSIKKKKGVIFQYPILVLAVYLCLGFIWELWHPTWLLFITILIYYIIFAYVDHKK